MMSPLICSPPSQTHGPLILAIDDSEIALAMVKANLAEFGLTNVVTFTHPFDGLEQLRSGEIEPDLILLDVMMPEINGIDLCAEIRCIAGCEDVPIIMLTSLEDKGVLSRAFLARANDYVTKPFDSIELEARINTCLRLGSELRRRKSSEARLMNQLRLQSADGIAADQKSADLLVSRPIFDAVLRACGPSGSDRLCLVLVALRRDRQSPLRGELEEPKLLARTLGSVELPANSLMAQIEANLFCFIAMDLSEDTSKLVAQRLSTAVEASDFADPLNPFGKPLALQTAVVWPSANYPVSAALADGINRVRLL